MKTILKSTFLWIALITFFPFQTAFAADNVTMTPKIISSENGITVYQDAAGGLVFSGLPVPFTATEKEQAAQKSKIETYESSPQSLEQFIISKLTAAYLNYDDNPVKVTAIAAGANCGYAVKSNGTVWAWGFGDDGELGNGTNKSSSTPVQVSGL